MTKLSMEGVRVLEGPSYYLEKPAVLFDLRIEGDEPRVGDVLRALVGQFTSLEHPEPADLGEGTQGNAQEPPDCCSGCRVQLATPSVRRPSV